MQFGSEIMLQQTLLKARFLAFSAAFPTVLIWLKPMKKRC
jgi:hypothetical protein